jgi:ribonuclease HI
LGPELHTNNYAEFRGLINLLQWLDTKRIFRVLIFSDSKLVVNTVNDEWKLAEESLVPLRNLARGFMIRGSHSLQHCKGHAEVLGNEQADKECNRILDEIEEVKPGLWTQHTDF